MTLLDRRRATETSIGVLVTDGNERAALAVTRGLGQAGIPVVVGAESRSTLAGASRYCRRKWLYPSPLVQPREFIQSINDAVQAENLSCIISVTDATTQVLAERREELGSAAVTIPPVDSYDLVSDKYRLMKLAQQLEIPIPDSLFVPDGNVLALAEAIRTYPVAVKPGRSLIRVDGRWHRTVVHFASSREELVELYGRVPYLRYPSLIQRRVEGAGMGVFGLFQEGKPCALFAHRRLREKPPAGGVSVLRESIALQRPMVDYAVRLLEHVKWNGVAMVEFKTDRQSGEPVLMEINGRFWGSLQLAIDAGLNFPHLLYQAARGLPVSLPDQSYRVGIKSRWLLGDLDHLLIRLTKSNEELGLDSSAQSRWGCVVEFLKLFQRDLHYEVERWRDPGPAWFEYRTWLGHVMGASA
jgi:predicted ATP-grasp superfamily ATP-dependent carboligase